ncbi:MAG: hypothetical protein Fur0032_01310 [Terrimicrobiaceae bacterium]
MNSLTAVLRKEIRQHNRQCSFAALSSLFLAWLAWVVAYGLAGSIGLLVETLRTGPDATYPVWLNPWLAGAAAFLLLWGAWDTRRRRFHPPPDRPVIGWHMLPDVLLLPPRLTFAVGQHLGARIRLSHHELEAAAAIILAVATAGRLPAHSMNVDFPDTATTAKALPALQILRWIDLHKGEEGWFYRLVSDREPELSTLDHRM